MLRGGCKDISGIAVKRMFSDKVDNYITKEDILFSSSSTAAKFLLGYSVSGPQRWKTKDGRSLKEI